jgi:hypothetical protein
MNIASGAASSAPRYGGVGALAGTVGAMFDDALMRVLLDSDPVPSAVVEHVVTGGWPSPQVFCDIAIPQPE